MIRRYSTPIDFCGQCAAMTREYFRAHLVPPAYCRRHSLTTHVSVIPAYHLHIADDAHSQDEFARFVYEANRDKEPVAIREHLTAHFAMHLTIEIMGRSVNEQVLKELIGSVGKRLVAYMPDMADGIETVLFKACVTGGLRGQVVFPNVIVNSDRARQLRRALIEDMMRLQPALEQNLTVANKANKLFTVVKEVDTQNGVVVPLCATTSQPLAAAETALTPLGVAVFTDSLMTPLPSPDDRWNWVTLGLKRRADKPPLTKLQRPPT